MVETSVLSTLGVEIIGVMSPVSICMSLVVLLVSSLSSSPSDPALSSIRTAANMVYLEKPTDSTVQKLEGSLLNAFVFVALIAVVTFLLVLLYYYNFTNFLKNYMRFSAFFVLASMGGSIAVAFIGRFSIPVDAVTFSIVLFNFTIAGVASLFSTGTPILVRQGYMVCLGIIVAAWFTRLPEWTTWSLLIALALYDLVAVLAPGGPLKLLVELASTRDDDLPALVYEARPTPASSRSAARLLIAGASSDAAEAAASSSSSSSHSIELQPLSSPPPPPDPEAEERSPLMSGSRDRPEEAFGEAMMDPGIKLGLGDFIFYSVLVGRAAMYDLMTVYACYLAIVSGLACTLMLLSVVRQALPALPISIALGVIFYFLTRLLMEPFVVGASVNLVMF
ncbi:Presenilin-like protein [Acorus calamus]|uniref:Presenilin n=1 Tax=Acorus calamus TaxID=4465 RepID=A0AAV9F0V8_ACOCL|nr:Presenilin-like protein [Acorus calamus]